MDNISKLSVEEILNDIGVNLTDDDVRIILNGDQEALQHIVEMRMLRDQGDELDEQRKMFFNGVITKQVLIDYEEKVNKKYLVLLTLYNSVKKLEDKENPLSVKGRKEVRAWMKKSMTLIGDDEFTLADLAFDKKTGRASGVRVINSTELIKHIDNSKNIEDLNKPPRKKVERLKEIDERIGFENIAQIVDPQDIIEIFSTIPEAGEAIATQISLNSIQVYLKEHFEHRKAIEELYEGIPLPREIQDEIYRSEEYRVFFKEALIANAKYIDIDKLLLTIGNRFVNLIENHGDTLEINQMINGKVVQQSREETLLGIEQILQEVVMMVKKDTKILIIENLGEEAREYTTVDLEKDRKRFQQGKHIKKSEVEDLRKSLLENEITLEEADPGRLRAITMENGDLTQLIKNSEENVLYLINQGIITKEDAISILYMREKCSEKLFFIMQEKFSISYEEMIELFEDGIINGDIFSEVEDEEIRKKIKDYSKASLKNAYREISKEEEIIASEELENFNKYANLYKILNIYGKDEVESIENANDLVASFEEEIDSKTLEKLYQFGLIPLEVAADWGVDLNEMLAHNSIKPTDLKELYGKQVIKIEQIRNVLISGELPYEEKLDLIYSTFDGESEEDYTIREELVGIIGIGETYKTERSTGKKIKAETQGTKGKEFVTDPHSRWKLISLLDKDYSKKFLPKEITDGHRVFLLPNQDSIVIEKMHEKRRGKKVSAYGSATYILTTDNFFKNIDDIIIDGAINRGYLRELAENEKANKIIHSKSWGESIKQYFNINEENEKYTEKEIQAIDDAIRNVENSRKERE